VSGIIVSRSGSLSRSSTVVWST